jgi:hypothetical protein
MLILGLLGTSITFTNFPTNQSFLRYMVGIVILEDYWIILTNNPVQTLENPRRGPLFRYLGFGVTIPSFSDIVRRTVFCPDAFSIRTVFRPNGILLRPFLSGRFSARTEFCPDAFWNSPTVSPDLTERFLELSARFLDH